MALLSLRRGEVVEIINKRGDCWEILVAIDGKEYKAVNYEFFSGSVRVGDLVLLNTTAVELGLGTGGYHFVVSNLKLEEKKAKGAGHIMKLRYTPLQHKVLSVEEEASPYRRVFEATHTLQGTPVIAAELHSMVAPIVLGLQEKVKNKRIVYVMTEGGALPLSFSKTIDQLKKQNLIQGTVTVGNAFGGDVEAINIYSGLLAAKGVFQADVIVVAMGPGIAGTGSKWGFSGVEQGQVLNAAYSLGGRPVAVPRISFADSRPRHQGLSHHTITVLKHVTLVPVTVPMAHLPPQQMNKVLKQWQEAQLKRCNLKIIDVSDYIFALDKSPINLSTMGRGLLEDQAFFYSAMAAGIFAGEILME